MCKPWTAIISMWLLSLIHAPSLWVHVCNAMEYLSTGILQLTVFIKECRRFEIKSPEQQLFFDLIKKILVHFRLQLQWTVQASFYDDQVLQSVSNKKFNYAGSVCDRRIHYQSISNKDIITYNKTFKNQARRFRCFPLAEHQLHDLQHAWDL